MTIPLLVLALLVWALPAQAELDPASNQYITQGKTFGLSSSNQADANFGFAVATAQNSLLIGAPNLSVGGKKAGGVFQIVGLANEGLAEHDHNRIITQASPGMSGSPESGDRFGYAVAAGFFRDNSATCDVSEDRDCGGDLDIIIGVPGEDLKDTRDAGMVNIDLPGAKSKVLKGNDALYYISQAGSKIMGTPSAGDRFGSSFAVGDFNGDGADDLGIGAPYEDVGSYDNAGGINVVMGDSYRWDISAEGLTGFNDQVWSQQLLSGARKKDENFGRAMAAGDFNGDGVDDLAIGVPNDNITKGKNAKGGAIHVIYGDGFEQPVINEGGLFVIGQKHFHQNTDGIGGGSEDGDKFGASLAAGDFNDDGYDDLAVGVPGEDIDGVSNTGMIHILYGGSDRGTGSAGNFLGGLSAKGSKTFHQSTKGVPGKAEKDDRFGASLAAGDMNGDGVDDVIVGVPGEDLRFKGKDYANAGAVVVLHGSRLKGVTSSGSYSLYHGKVSRPSKPIAGMQFGYSLAVGDLNLDGLQDLAVGSNTGGSSIFNRKPKPGSVTVIYQK